MSEAGLEAACLVECRTVLGEGPVWVAREGAVYWVDIKAPAIFRWVAATAALSRWSAPFGICSLAPSIKGGFVAGTEHGFAFVDPEESNYELFHNPEPLFPRNRFNDGKVDRLGRFWAGTMDDEEEHARGALYRLNPDLNCTCIDAGYHVPNGPAFDPAGKRMYHSDSAKQLIYLFDLAPDGSVAGKRVFARFGEGEGYPDGMTVDAEGCLWVAFWDGWCLRRFSPQAELLAEVPVPVQRPTSCAFGGRDLDQLFITSARIGLDENQLAMQPLAGALFMVRPAIGGVPDPAFG